MDGIIIIGTDKDCINNLIKNLASEFAIKDLRRLHYFLKVAIKYFKAGLFLTQSQYVKDLLQWVGMTNFASISTLMVIKEKFKPTENYPVDSQTYRSIV